MEKRFDPSSYEKKWQERWSEGDFFVAEAPSSKPSFCIMIPPPNVTGNLHAGHALQTTIQDLLTRWKRMCGYNALWLPGTDHAGIATQLMVERQLIQEGTDRQSLGRELFLERAWEWTRQHSGHIRSQLDRLGASCDWSRERFTLDELLSKAVRAAFVSLYREGLIARGEYMVNWSPGLETAISDLEVEMRAVAGKLYHIAYPVEGSDERIVVATTRPETMLGDTAVAMHPEDDRYAHLRGGKAILPLVGRQLAFITDEAVELEFGTGLVKVTPAHDLTDFEMGQRHDLESLQVIDRKGRMTAEAGAEFAGLDRFVAREKVVQMLQEQGYLVKVEDYAHNVGHCQRSGVAVEPMISTQWFMDVEGMAGQALEAVASGDLRLVPDSWNKTWDHWLENIRPWCISRQLWWGHQIPAWYTPSGEVFVAASREEAAGLAGTDEITQDPDVLDTWFSSALWPFSTLGWPEDSADFRTFYPTDVLVTGFDIIFFWVARMVMTGLHFTGCTPFHAVHLTGLIRDADGQKMSKTRGNTVDPMELVEEYGADAVRFTLAILDSPGRDIPLDLDRMAGYRSFGNKIWNAVRFSLSRVGRATVQESLEVAELAAPERWILSRLSKTAKEVNEKFAEYRFDEACQRLYHFFWGELCDWYIEISKPALAGDSPRPQVGEVLLTVLDRSLRLLHPVMPYLTEELWQRLPGREEIHPATICLAPYPVAEEAWEDPVTEGRMEVFFQIVAWARNLRAELGVPPRDRATLFLDSANAEIFSFLGDLEAMALPLLRLDELRLESPPANAHSDVVAAVAVGLVIPEREISAEDRQRLVVEREKLLEQRERTQGLLANEAFLAKAPDKVVEQNRLRLEEIRDRLERLEAGLAGDGPGIS
ncbi:MAG: valine--tRNA ligase [Thermoanaerobaculia bacterium]